MSEQLKITDSLLLDFVNGVLDSEIEERIRRVIEDDENVKARVAAVSNLRSAFQRRDTYELDGFFTERVVQRVYSTDQQGFAEQVGILWKLFRPVLTACLIIIALLGAYSFQASTDDMYPRSTSDVLLGVEAASIASAYDIDE